MPVFGKKSLSVLSTCCPDLVIVANEAIKHVDFSVICGHRNKVNQNKAVASGNSKTPWPKSMHNRLPSYAFDFVPYPESDKAQDYVYIAGLMVGLAIKLKEEGAIHSDIRYGGDFNGNGQVSDDGWDFGHIEIL